MYSLSSVQEEIWLDQTLHPTLPIYNIGGFLHVSGPVNPHIFNKAIASTVQKHDSLRTILHRRHPIPVQEFFDNIPLDIPLIDFSRTPAPGSEADRWMQKEFIKPFSLYGSALFRFALLRLSPQSYYWYCCFHHLIADGWTVPMFVRQVGDTYNSLQLKDSGHFENVNHRDNIEKKYSYIDFIRSDAQYLKSKAYEEHKKYWLDKYSDVPEKLFSYSNQSTLKGQVAQLWLEPEFYHRITQFAKKFSVSAFHVILAGLYCYFTRTCHTMELPDNKDFVIGLPLLNRPSKAFKLTSGVFTRVIPSRFRFGQDLDFSQLLTAVARELRKDYRRQRFPVSEINRHCELQKRGRSRLFDLSLSFENFDFSVDFNGAPVDFITLSNGCVQEPLAIAFKQYNGLKNKDIRIDFAFQFAVFEYDDIQRIIKRFRFLLENVLISPNLPVHRLPLIPEDEKRLIMEEWNRTQSSYPDTSIHRLFEKQVEKTPDRTALTGQTYQLTYAVLNEHACSLAHRLETQYGVRPGDTVAVIMNRSERIITALLGILKSGAAYVPIDPLFPGERKNYILNDCSAKAVIRASHGHDEYEFAIDSRHQSSFPAHSPVQSPVLAYIIYTSGSSGKPKGVMVEHPSVVNLLNALWQMYSSDSTSVYLLKTALVFDVSIPELFAWHHNGGKLAILEKEGEKNPRTILEAISKYSVTHINFVPSMFSAFSDSLGPQRLTAAALRSLKYIFLAGEVLPAAIVQRFREKNNTIKLENLYGPTEATVYASRFSLENWNPEHAVSIGTPLANTAIYILDRQGNLLPIGVTGEICIRGAGVALGYLNKPELTAQRFVTHAAHRPIDYNLRNTNENQSSESEKSPLERGGPRSGGVCPKREGPRSGGVCLKRNRTPEFPLYRTGDLGSWRSDGQLMFSGRIDTQVKIRGFRIELEEIEHHLLNHPQVRQAVVLAQSGEEVDRLTAYIAAKTTANTNPELTAGMLKEHLGFFLPAYMIPVIFVFLDKLPLNPSGKANRKALARLKPSRVSNRASYSPPRNETESVLLTIWRRVLGIDHIGVDDNFFDCGGHSLSAIRIAALIYQQFSVEAGISVIFNHPTIVRLADAIYKFKSSHAVAIQPTEKRQYYELSHGQQRLWLLNRFDEARTAYNMPAVFSVRGELDIENLHDAFNALVQRHESLRTSFRIINSIPRQIIHQSLTVSIGQVYAEEDQLEFLFTQHANTVFDLTRPPLFKLKLLAIEPSHHILLFNLHHIIADGWSMDVLLKDLTAFYNQSSLPPLAVQYKDYTKWQNRRLDSGVNDAQKKYWLQTLPTGEDIPVLLLASDYPRPALRTYAGHTLNRLLNRQLTRTVKDMCRDQGITLFMALVAAGYILLSRYSGQQDIIIGSPSAGRHQPELHNQAGFYVNTLALRQMLNEQHSSEEFLQQVKQTAALAYENQDYPFDLLVEDLNVPGDPGRHPLFDVMIVLQNQSPRSYDCGSCQITAMDMPSRISKFDLTLSFAEHDGNIRMQTEYNTALFKEERIQRMTGHFTRLLQQMALHPQKKLLDLAMLSEAEHSLLLYRFNDTFAEFPGEQTIDRLFMDQAQKSPNHIALIHRSSFFTYRQLQNDAAGLAAELQKKGVGPGTIAAVTGQRSPKTITALLAILIAGGCFLPIDPELPAERIDYFLRDSNASLLIDTGGSLSIKPLHTTAAAPEPAAANTSDIAYIMYTSGSTGHPKGVIIEHRSVLNTLMAFIHRFNINRDTAIIQLANYNFDPSVEQIFSTLLKGARLVLPTLEIARHPAKLYRFIESRCIDILNAVPLMLAELLTGKSRIKSIKHVISGGDILDNTLKNDLINLGYDLYNFYGPTETTIEVLTRKCSSENVNLGSPIANMQCYIMDRYNRLLPAGVPGEICISGKGVARGYLNNPELSSEAFIPHPFIAGKKLYKTGDLGLRLPEGSIQYLGRIDRQIKIKGQRIELSEIEHLLRNHAYIHDAAVVAYKTGNHTSQYRLTAFVVFKANENVSSPSKAAELRDYLTRFLPPFQIPAQFIFLESLPVNSAGKIHWKQLEKRAAQRTRSTGDIPLEPPRNPIQVKLLAIWQEILELQEIGIYDNFFQLGGHSLNAARVAAYIQNEFSVEVSLSAIFKNPTIEALAAIINQNQPLGHKPILPIGTREYYDLTHSQRRLWVLNQFEGAGAVYNIPAAFDISGSLDVSALEAAFKELICRHESLRTSFISIHGQPKQVIHRHVPVSIEQKSIAFHQLDSEILSAARNPLDLSSPPLLNITLFHTRPTRYTLLLTIHHIIADGWSIDVLFQDLLTFYNALTAANLAAEQVENLQSLLPELPFQYKDFASWQNRLLEDPNTQSIKEYWMRTLTADALPPVLDLPADFPRPAVRTYEGGLVQWPFTPSLSAALSQTGQTHQITGFMTLLSAVYILIHRYTGCEDIITGTPIAARSHPGLEEQIGFYIDTMPLRCPVKNHYSIADLFQHIDQVTTEAYENQLYPFDRLVDDLELARDTSRHPLFDIMVVYHNNRQRPLYCPSFQMTPRTAWAGISKFDLTFNFVPRDSELDLYLEYNSALFDEDRIHRLCTHLTQILQSFAVDSHTKIQNIDLLTQGEKHLLVTQFNGTQTSFPEDKSIVHLWLDQVEKTPDAVAVQSGQNLLSYSALDRQASLLAHKLKSDYAVRPDSPVALLARRNERMIIAIIAILKSGGAYVPIDPDFPPQRTGFILKDCNTRVLVNALDTLNLEPLAPVSASSNQDTNAGKNADIQPSHLAYILYTSGSTGAPKGVMITHRSVVNLVYALYRRIYARYGSKLRVALAANYVFDASVQQIFAALLGGHCLSIIDNESKIDPWKLNKFLQKNNIQICDGTPTLLSLMTLMTGAQRQLIKPSALKHLIIGGEVLSNDQVNSFYNHSTFNSVTITNIYGPAESTVDVCAFDCTGPVQRPQVPIGKPLNNTTIHILDKNGHLTPIGVTGEICISGIGLARGYLNKPELTAQRFITHAAGKPNDYDSKNTNDKQSRESAKSPLERGGPRSGGVCPKRGESRSGGVCPKRGEPRSGGVCPNGNRRPESLLYHTGDLGTWDAEGNILFMGRQDDQVKIRGFRIELGEIKSRIQTHPHIAQAVVTTTQVNGHTELIAFFVPTGGTHSESLHLSLREHIEKYLPAYMMPSYFIPKESMPLTSSGKIDKNALLHTVSSSALDTHRSGNSHAPPTTPTQAALVRIWKEVLRLDNIGIHDAFFQLGGHSLKAVQIVSRIYQELSVDIPLRFIFRNPDIYQLSRLVEQKTPSQFIHVQPVEEREYYPLSAGQRRVWVLSQFEDQRTLYNMPAVFSLTGSLDIAALEQAIGFIIHRHQCLRTVFISINNIPVQIIHPCIDFHLDDIELNSQTEIAGIIRQHAEHVFDLSLPPLFRISLVKESDNRYILLFNMHHIIGDGWSAALLIEELSNMYHLFSQGQPVPHKPPSSIQYRDYALWQYKLLNDGRTRTLKEYWLKTLNNGRDLPVLNVPADFPRPTVKTYDGSSFHWVLEEHLSSAVNELAEAHGLTLFMTLLAAVYMVLYRYTGQDEIILGTPVAGRDHPDLENQIGFYVNTLALRQHIGGYYKVSDFLSHVKQTVSEAFEHRLYPFDHLVDELDLPRDTSHHPLFDVMVVLQNNIRRPLTLNNIKIEPIPSPARTSKFDLTFEFEEQGANIHLTLEYQTRLFKEQRIQRLNRHFKQLLRAMVSDSSQEIRHIDILSKKEKQNLQEQLNDNNYASSHPGTVLELFNHQVRRSPHAAAVINKNCFFSYLQLDTSAQELARDLRQKGGGPGTIAAIHMERSPYMIIAVLAILKTGAAYLPLAPGHPEERKSYMLQDSNANVKVIWSDGFQVQSLAPHAQSTSSYNEPQAINPAYIIYTSGSTGRPKGVIIEHRSLANYVQWANRYYFHQKPYGHFGLFTSITFDLTVTAIFCTITRGKSLYIYPPSQEIHAILEHSFSRFSNIDCIKMTPSHISVLDSLKIPATNIRLVIAGGEELTPKHAAIIKDIDPDIQIVNEYGPTEATVGCIFKTIQRSEAPIPIGKPAAGAGIHILDRDGVPLPPGIPGEIYIAGPGLARGYLNQPELTAKRFENSNSQQSATSMSDKKTAAKILPSSSLRLYRTGDLGCLLEDGNIQYLGRIDSQVKIRGYRIELAEIEQCLLAHPLISEAAVIANQYSSNQSKQLSAFVSLTGQSLEESQLRKYLGRVLPAYMIPHDITILDRLPLTSHGKIDKTLLADFAISHTGNHQQYTPPGSDIERILVDIWQQVLRKESIGIDDNFFQSGGDSIKAIQIAARLHQSGLKMELKALFNHPTIKELSPLIRQSGHTPSQSVESGPVELTPIQHWFFENHSSYPQAFNQALMLFKKDRFEQTLLARSFEHIIRHHDALRMVYDYGSGRIDQQNKGIEEPLFHLDVIDIGQHNGNWKQEVEQTAHRLLHDIDLKTGPMVKLALFKTQQGDHLLIVIHHLVIDGVSWRILLEDFRTAYQSLEKGETVSLPGKTDSFRLWAVKQKEYAGTTQLLRELDYWKGISKNGYGKLPPLTPLNGEKLSQNTGDKNNRNGNYFVSIQLTAQETRQLLEQTNHTYNTEINDMLLTALALALEKAWGLNKIMVNLEGHGREEIIDDVNISRTIGWFTSQFPIMLDISKSADLSYRIRSIKDSLRRIPNKGIGFGILKYLSSYGDELSHYKAPAINFNYLGEFSLENQLNNDTNGLFTLSELNAGNGSGPQKHNRGTIDIDGIMTNQSLHLRFGFNCRSFEKKAIETLAQFYKEALIDLVHHCANQLHRRCTPADFGCPGLSLESLDYITRSLNLQHEEEIDKIYPLSPMQEGLLFHWLMDRQSSAYFEQFTFQFQGHIDPIVLETSIHDLIGRHDILRTAFVYKNIEMPVQVVLKQRPITLVFHDLRLSPDHPEHHYSSRTQHRIQEYREADKKAGFDLTAEPLMRFSLFRTGETAYVLIWSHHHILMDGWCMSIFFKELFTIYRAHIDYQPPRLAPAVPFMNYIHWLEKQDKEESLAYWEHYLNGLESPTGVPYHGKHNPVDYGKTGEPPYLSRSVNLQLDEQQTAGLNRLAARSQVTMNTLFQTIWSILLMRYNNTFDVVFGAVVSGRSAKIQGIESILGLFINTLPVRIRAEAHTTFSGLIVDVQTQALESRAREYLPLSDIQSKTELKSSLIDHITVFQNYPFDQELTRLSAAGNISLPFALTSYDAEEQTNYNLNVVSGPDDCLKIVFYYNATVYDHPFIEQVAGHYKQAVLEILNDENIPVNHIAILTDLEKYRLLVDFNRTAAPYPHNRSIPECFTEQVIRTPAQTAVIQDTTQHLPKAITYRFLDEAANRLANYLSNERSLVPGQPVGIMLDRGSQAVISLIAVLKAGGVFVPIAPSLPEERIKHIVIDSGMTILIGQKKYLRTLNRLQWECSNLDTLLCIDSLDIHSEEEVEENELMSRKLWEYVGESAVDDVTGGGWNSSYTGQPLSTAEMDEYGDNVLKKLKPFLHKDMRVLEIGTASGITMFRIAPHIGFYYGTDLSRVIIEKNRQRVNREGHTNIKLRSLAAHDIHLLDQADFDLVILNSVIQCFKGHNYLENVIRKIISLMRDNSTGYIFIGDIMDLDRKNELTAELQQFKTANKGRNVKTNTDQSQELFISRAFLEDLVHDFPAICNVRCSDKIYTIENELTRFRYDALLQIDKKSPETPIEHENKLQHRHKHRHDLSTINKYPGQLSSPIDINPHDLAYIIYTSGSTGKPKGVMIEHSGFINMSMAQIRDFDVTPADRVLQFSSISFDASMSEIFMALFAGAALVLIQDDQITDIHQFLNLITRHLVSVITLPPSYLRELTLAAGPVLSKMKTLITAGEPPVAEDILHYSPVTRYFNAYGPTEISVCAAYFQFPESYNGPPPIGTPIANTAIFILDKQGFPQPQGISGEICISGPGLARGYLNNPELTASRFEFFSFDNTLHNTLHNTTHNSSHNSLHNSLHNTLQNTISGSIKETGVGSILASMSRSPSSSLRLYRTGDAGYFLPDGNIVFTGRIDRQVKIRGYRIELSEIESVLSQHNDIESAAVIYMENPTGHRGEKQLTAYYKPKNKIECWPSLSEYYLYDDLLYHTMTNDDARNQKFRSAIRKAVKDKVILEIGPGSDAVLSRMCVEHGAQRVYAVELLEEAWRKAKDTVSRLGLEEKIILIHGDITTVTLPEKVDYCVSEIVGAIGGSEGAAKLINHARPMLKNPAHMIPMRSLTRIAAVTLPEDEFDYSFEELGAQYVEKVFQHVGYSFDLRLCLHSFPKKNVISSTGVFEDLDFRNHIPLEETHDITLDITRGATLHGFIVWLNLYVDQDECIDALERKYIWLPVYFPVFPDGEKVQPGDGIQAQITRTLCQNRLNPDFEINGTLHRQSGETVRFQYHSLHITTAYKANEFYERIFSGDTVNISKPLTGAEMKQYLESRLPAYMLPDHYVQLQEIPLTAHGKIDLKALPAPCGTAARDRDAQSILPRNEIEAKLVNIWQTVLGQPQVGIADNFFELGGNSLKIIRLAARLNEAFQENIPIARMFEYPTIQSFAGYFTSQRSGTANENEEAKEPKTKTPKRSKLHDRKQRVKRTREQRTNGPNQ